eukprot:2996182-Alexandrium_andersonii.AAC.1
MLSITSGFRNLNCARVDYALTSAQMSKPRVKQASERKQGVLLKGGMGGGSRRRGPRLGGPT